MYSRKSVLGILYLLFALAIAVPAVYSQGTTTRITGTVTDTSGAAVSGATVTLTNEGTQSMLTTQSSDSGAYTFDLIQVGTYQVKVEKTGFKTFVSRSNSVNINQPGTINAALEVGDVSAIVSVESTVEQVQTSTSGNIGTTFEQKTLESLPIVNERGRNPLNLLNFTPGVVNGANTGGGVHVNGSRDRSFNFTLDGVDINESSAGGSNFTPLRPNPDSLQEFQVVTSNFTAELGRSSGAQVTFVTRSGTNDFHGTLFEFYQTPRFNAKDYNNTILNTPKQQFVQHIFGGSLGGPIPNFGIGEGTPFKFLKDRAFFFVNLQMLRASDTSLVTRTVLTSQARAGIFRYVQGGKNANALSSNPSVDAGGNSTKPACSATVTTNCIAGYNIAGNASGITRDPLLVAALNAQPLPNNFTVGDGLNTAGFNFASPQRERQYDFVSKFDFKINDKNAFYIRYAQGSQNTFGDSANGGRPIFPDSPNLVDTFRTPKNLAVNYRWSPTATFTNEFIFGLNQFGFDFVTPQPDPSIPYAFNLTATANTNFSYNARRLRTLQFVDNVTFDLSPHIIKAGTNMRFGRQIDDRSSVANTNVEPIVGFARDDANDPAFAPFCLPGSACNPSAINLPSSTNTDSDLNRLKSAIKDQLGWIRSYSQAFVSDQTNPGQFAPAGTRWNYSANYPELDFYVQDNWRFRPNLTFDIGLRWEAKLHPTSNDRPILQPNQPFVLGAAPSNTLRWTEGTLFDNDYSKFLPSIGFAYDPFKDGKTSIRANYRIASDRFGTQLFASAIFQNAPGNTFQGVPPAPYDNVVLLRNGLENLAPTSSPDVLRQPAAFSSSRSINVIDPDLQFPVIHSWSVSVQREVFKDNVIEINYIGKKGTHLFGGYNSNQVDIFASRNGQTFLDAFNQVRGNPTYSSPLINALYTGDPNNAAGTARFRATNTSAIASGNVATAALALSQLGCSGSATNPNITTGRCTSSPQLIVNTIGNGSFFQRYPQFTGGLFVLDSNDFSFYNGLEIIFKRRIRSGLGFQVGYTLSKSKDTRSFDPLFTTVATGSGQTASATPFDNRNRRLNYAWSDFDRRHVLQGTYTYELPFGKGKSFETGNGVVDYLLGGWQLSGNLLVTSGRPFTVFTGLFTLSNSVSTTANCSNCSRDLGSVQIENGTTYFFTAEQRALFSSPGPGELGNTGRNFFIGPKYFQTDASLSKRFKFSETVNFELRADTVNLTNSPAFGFPNLVTTDSISPFGRIRTGVTNTARRIQFGGKLNF